MRIRDVIAVLEQDGWIPVRNEETLRQWRRRGLRGRVTIAGRLDDELAAPLLQSIAKQAHLPEGLL